MRGVGKRMDVEAIRIQLVAAKLIALKARLADAILPPPIPLYTLYVASACAESFVIGVAFRMIVAGLADRGIHISLRCMIIVERRWPKALDGSDRSYPKQREAVREEHGRDAS